MASNVAGFNEVLGGNNECGVLVAKGSVSEAADAMCHMIDHPEKALEKVNKARKRAVDLYNWDNNVKQMIRVYDWVLKDK
jgi:glycosyltransferase involved in cell wall biosynthesis